MKLSHVFATVAILIVTATIARSAHIVASFYDAEVNTIENRLEIPAQAMARVIAGISTNADLALRDVQAAAGADPGLPGSSVRTLMLDLTRGREAPWKIEIYDAAGTAIVSTLSDPPIPVSVAGYDFFKRQIAAPSNRLIVSDLVADPIDGEPKIIESRPIIDRAGIVRGVAALYLDANHLQKRFDPLPLPPGSSLSLFNADGKILVRTPAVKLGDPILATDFSERAGFQAFRNSASREPFGKFTMLDGSSRFLAHFGAEDSPFAVTAGWDAAAALAHWRSLAATVIFGTFAAIVIVGALFGYLVFQLRRNEALLKTLSDGEAKFRDVMTALPDSVLLVDRSLTIVFANPAAEKLYGYEPGEINGMAMGRMMRDARRSSGERSIRAAFTRTEPHSGARAFERVARRKDGSELPVEVNASPYRTPEGTMLIIVTRDISERRINELALHRSRENLARAQRVAGVGSFVRDLVKGETEQSDELLRIHGVEPDSPQAQLDFLYGLIHPEDREKVEAFRRQAASGMIPPSIDYRIIRPDGVERTLYRICDIQFDESHKPTRLCSTVQDITERKTIELELRRSRENLARAQRVAAVGSFERDIIAGKTEYSDEFMRIWGLEGTPPRLIAESLLPFVHPDDRGKFIEGRDLALQRKPVPPLDFRITRPDGENRILHREYGVVFDADGKAVRMFGTVQDITERKTIELELRRSRENLARAQRNAGLGSFDRDLVTGELEISDELYRIHGVEPGIPLKRLAFLHSLIHPEDRERVEEFRRQVESGLMPPSIDYRIVRPDGIERTLHRTGSLLRDESGKPIRRVGTLQDITERKTIELELRHSRENLARAQRDVRLGSFERDVATGKFEVSDELYSILGIDRGSSQAQLGLIPNLVHAEDRERIEEFRRQVENGLTPPPIDIRIVRPDGIERTLHRTGYMLRDDNGKPVRVVGTIQDITERKTIELELQMIRENLARAQRVARIGSIERDLVSGRWKWSDELYRLYGLTPGDPRATGEFLRSLIHPDDRARFEEVKQLAVSGTAVLPLEYRIIRPDGAERIIHRESEVVCGADGTPLWLIATMQDVTEQRIAERHERQLERQLLHSQKLEALGTLAGGIAHDLNNTLVPIMALSRLTARRFEPGNPARANLDTIFEASARARDLVKRIVAFSRNEESEKKDTDLAAVVGEALKLLRATLPASLRLEARLGEVPSLPADAAQIHQVITNLVTNAVQAIGQEMGTITVMLDVVAGVADTPEIRLSVCDTGIGMDEATTLRIFEPFFTTKAVGQGTGLGLSIVHGIVAGHGGRIAVASEPGKGTRFDLYFPLAQAAASPASSRPAA